MGRQQAEWFLHDERCGEALEYFEGARRPFASLTPPLARLAMEGYALITPSFEKFPRSCDGRSEPDPALVAGERVG